MLNDLSTVRSLEDIRLLYFKYKDTPYFAIGIILIIFFITLFLFWKTVIPQVNNWFSMQDDIKKTNEEIALLKNNQLVLDGITDQELSNQFTTATKGLPYEKDYAGIIASIDDATILAGLQRDDYSLQVGDLSTKSAALAPETSLSVKISLRGKVDQVQKFLQQLNKQLPLSEAVTVSFENDGAVVGLIFFYKYIPEGLQISYTQPVRSLTGSQKSLLQTLDSWTRSSTPIPRASSSAETTSLEENL